MSHYTQAKITQGNIDGTYMADQIMSPGMYAILIMERTLSIYKVSDWTNMDAAFKAGAKAGNTYGIITDEQLALSNSDTYTPMTVIPGGVIVPKAPFGSWIEWESSDENVCLIDSGQLTPISEGECTITAYYRRAGETVTDSCKIVITE